MKLETKPNRHFNGKLDKTMPVAAVVDGEVIAVGESVTAAKDNAVAELMAVYEVRSSFPAMRIASDGTVWIARLVREDVAEVIHYYPADGKPAGFMRDGGSQSGYLLHTQFLGRGCTYRTLRNLQDVLDYRMEDYEDAIAPAVAS